jgi:hypothetical protein
MSDKFKKGDYVRKKNSQRIVTGWIEKPKDVQGRYLVKFDPSCNDISLGDEILVYEDELEPCSPPKEQ